MFSSSSPNSSPLGNRGSHQQWRLHKPNLSSPLSPTSSSTQTAWSRRKSQYKSQVHGRTASIPGITEDSPQKKFLRDRFMAQLGRSKENRAKVVRKGRQSSCKHGTSSDEFDMEGDANMSNDEACDLLDDEIYRRVVLSEIRRSQYAQRVSFEHDIGSSIDPNMYDDMDTLEMELTGHVSKHRPLSPPEGTDLDDDLIQEYLADLQEAELKEMQERVVTRIVDFDKEDPSELEYECTPADQCKEQWSPSPSMDSDFTMSSPPPSRSQFSGSSFKRSFSGWICPFCEKTRALTSIACSSCITQHSLEDAQYFWLDPNTHLDVQDNRLHMPLVTKMPNESGMGVVLLCSESNCDWCYAL